MRLVLLGSFSPSFFAACSCGTMFYLGNMKVYYLARGFVAVGQDEIPSFRIFMLFVDVYVGLFRN